MSRKLSPNEPTRQAQASAPAPYATAEISVHERHPHSVQFYSDDKFLVEALSRFIGSALGAGDAAIVIATPEHRKKLHERLKARGLDVDANVEQGRYVALDAVETLQQFMADAWPDETRFVELIGGVITRAKAAAQRENGRAALFGEMVALLWANDQRAAALRLEQLWNQIAQSHSFSLVCGYPLSHFYREQDGPAFQQVCDEHTAVMPAEDFSSAAEDERLRMVAQWQQRAMAWEKTAAQRAQTQEAAFRLAAIVESAEDAIVSKDLNGIVSSWNAAAERIFGWKAEEIIGKSILTIIPPELHGDEDMILGKVRRGERIEHFETLRVRKDGQRIDVSLTISPIKNESGMIVGAAKIARDITKQKRAEEALRRAEKMGATGQLAASIAHEINNPMQSLTNLLALIGYKTSIDRDTRRLVQLAETELSRMSHIARQMLSFYRESATPVKVKPTEILDEVLELSVLRLRANEVRLQRRYEFDGEIEGYPVELRQLFANLLTNAIEAIGHKGQVLIHVTPWREPAGQRRRGVRILISDSGPGIRPEVRNPFFTTKAERGTGLGLWVVKGIIGKHGGSIRVRTRYGRERTGTALSVFLPAQESTRVVSMPGPEGDESAA
jgi:PAS domain S-box-containing protein